VLSFLPISSSVPQLCFFFSTLFRVVLTYFFLYHGEDLDRGLLPALKAQGSLRHRGQFSSIQRDCKCPRHLFSLTGFTTGIPVQAQSQNSIGCRIFFLGLCNLSVTLTDNLALQNDVNKGARMRLPPPGTGRTTQFWMYFEHG
jgi:hypothetical protein